MSHRSRMCRRRIKTGLGIDQKLFRKEYSLDPGSLQILPQKQPGPDLSDSEFDLNKKGKKYPRFYSLNEKHRFLAISIDSAIFSIISE